MSDDPNYITVKASCAIVGGNKPIDESTFQRDPELKALIEHPTRGTARVRRQRLIELLNTRSTEAK